MTPVERLILASQSIDEAKFLYEDNIGGKVVFPKLYHALMYCLFALFDIRIIGTLAHSDVIDRFEREYVRPGILDNGLLRVIRRAYDLTHECDCDHMPVPTDRDIEETMEAAERLLAEAGRIVGTGVQREGAAVSG
jgi:uncharacterized protein (UPF0332 family)